MQKLPALALAIVVVSPFGGTATPVTATKPDLVTVVGQHESGAPNREMELGLVEQLSRLSQSNRKAWRPDFWAAYFLTQVSMSHEDGRADNLKRAQQHMTEAFRRAKNDGEAPTSDLHSLQALVYFFASGQAEGEEAKDSTRAKGKDELVAAYSVGQHSPAAMVMGGTDMIRSGQREKDWLKVMAGHALLEKAGRAVEAESRPLGEATHFNAEWIQPWSEWVERMYEGGLDAE